MSRPSIKSDTSPSITVVKPINNDGSIQLMENSADEFPPEGTNSIGF